MKTGILCVLLTLLAVGVAQAQSPPAPPALVPVPRKRVAVLGVEIKVTGIASTVPLPSGDKKVVTLDIPQPAEFGTGLTDMLVTALVSSRRFIVVERAQMEDVLKEKALHQAGDVDPRTAVQAGRVLGAQILVRAAVTEMTQSKSVSGVGGLLKNVLERTESKAESTVGIDLKLVDIATGQILQAVRASGRARASASSTNLLDPGFRVGSVQFRNSSLGEACREAIQNAVALIQRHTDSLPWEAMVADQGEEEGKTILYLNAGSDSGLLVGDVLEVIRPGKVIRDPQTQVEIGRAPGRRIGRCQVSAQTQNIATAILLEGKEVRREDIVRFAARPAAKN